MTIAEQITGLEDEFNRIASSKAIELEGVTKEHEREMEHHRHLFELKHLSDLEEKLRKMELEKLKLMQQEARITANLVKFARIYGAQLEELEEMFEAEARRRELIITKLYARLNNWIRLQVEDAEGNLKTQMKSRATIDHEDTHRLFDGIRDQKLKANWNQTPQPICLKIMMARNLRDKVPKGEYVIRASVLDRLTDNKMYYKIIEYGERVKEQRHIEKEKAKRKEEDEAEAALKLLLEGESKQEESKEAVKEEDEIMAADDDFKAKINEPLF